MKKLKLAVDDLQVESFHSVDTPALEGTVRGNDATLLDCEPTKDRYDRNCASSIDVCGPTRHRECISDTAFPCYCE
jgi:hypothetical protein